MVAFPVPVLLSFVRFGEWGCRDASGWGGRYAGERVWADVLLPHIVAKNMPSRGQPVNVADVAVVYPACAVTCAMTCA